MTQKKNLNPHVFAPGDDVEICPYPSAHKVSFDNLQGLDGSVGKIIALADYAGSRVARVAIKSRDKNLAGIWRIPIKALKILSN